MTASVLATWVTFDGNGVQHALATNTRTECGRRLQGHDVTAQGPRNSLLRGCVLCTRRIDGYNAYGEMVRPQGDYREMLTELIAVRGEAGRFAVTLERAVAALRAGRAQTTATTEASVPVGMVASTNPATHGRRVPVFAAVRVEVAELVKGQPTP
jgi:hypothetical protein